jgi:hypothetical protein
MISGLTYTVRTTGFFSLYRGLAPTLIGSIPKAGIRFGLNSVIKDALRDKDGNLNPGKNFLAGLGAGVTEGKLVCSLVRCFVSPVFLLVVILTHSLFLPLTVLRSLGHCSSRRNCQNEMY